jgi:hypothetical protein
MNRERLRFIFGFLVVFGGALFLTRPDPNTAQTIFRLAMIASGVIGLTVMQMRGR